MSNVKIKAKAISLIHTDRNPSTSSAGELGPSQPSVCIISTLPVAASVIPRRRWKDNIKTDLNEMSSIDGSRSDSVQWRTLILLLLNIRFLKLPLFICRTTFVLR
jgi:hypothetical protein